VPGKTILEIPAAEQEQMLRELRAARYGYLLALHVLLLCAQGRTPSEIASFLFCSQLPHSYGESGRRLAGCASALRGGLLALVLPASQPD